MDGPFPSGQRHVLAALSGCATGWYAWPYTGLVALPLTYADSHNAARYR